MERSHSGTTRTLLAEHIRSSLRYTLENFDRMQHERDARRPVSLGLPQEVVEELERVEKELVSRCGWQLGNVR